MSWVSAVSKKTGGRYYHNSTTNKSLWHDDALPAGWGWEQAGPDAPRVYVNMTTGEHSTVRPARTSTSVAVEVPGAHSPPSTDGVPEAPQLPALSATGLRSSAAAPIAEQEFAQLVAIITSGDDVDAVRALMSRVGSAVAISLLSNCTSEKLPVTALGLAAKLGRSRIIEVLLREFGAPVNARAEHSGYTALSLAAHAGHAAIVAALLAAGADPQALNRWNETPLRVAEKRGHATVVRLLQGAVAGGSSAAASATLAELLAPTAVRTDKGVALSLRGVRPGDQAALVRLYGVCQAGYRGPDGSAEAATHDHWTERVFATDFADAAAHYSSVPRGGLWVATVSRAEFGARSGGADPEPVLLLADADGAAEVVVGCVALVPWHEAPLEGGAPAASDSGGGGGGACELQRMCAHPALRRSGIATALIDLVEKSAARLGYSHVQLTTLATMAPAVGLYAARGYTQVGPPGGTPVEFHGHVIYRTAFFKRLQQPAGAAAAAPAMVAPPAATPPAAADEPPPVLPHGTTYVPQGQVDAAIAAGPAAVHALAQSVAARITAGEIPFPYKRRFTARAQVEGWFAELRALPSALELTAGPYALHGFLDRGRGVAVRVAAYTAAADGSGGAVVARRARIVADGPLRLGQAPPAAPAAAGAAGPASPPLPPLSVTSFAGCGPVRKPFDREFNERGGLLVDFYSEQARMRARRRDQALGPVDAWREPPAALAIAAKALRKFGAVTDDSLRHGQYGVLNACNLFHANLARALFGLFGARRILDPCAGWGDRLMGAMGTPSVQRYLAADPNPDLAAPHAAMIRAHGPGAGGSYAVVGTPFEDLVVPAADAAAGFDLVLTSPPYFDLELYTPGPPQQHAAAAAAATAPALLQSTDRHPSQRDWLQGWYFPALAKAWRHLLPGGHMAIYINDHKAKPGSGGDDIDVCTPMLAYAAEHLPGALWVGVLGVEGETRQVRPLWVWRKEDGGGGAPLPPVYALAAAAAAATAAAGLGGGGGASGMLSPTYSAPVTAAGTKRRWADAPPAPGASGTGCASHGGPSG